MEKSIIDLMAGIKETWELPDVDVRTYSPLVGNIKMSATW